jgi:hypothetical protein
VAGYRPKGGGLGGLGPVDKGEARPKWAWGFSPILFVCQSNSISYCFVNTYTTNLLRNIPNLFLKCFVI